MKGKTLCAALLLCLLTAPLFGGGRQSGTTSAQDAQGLTTLKVFGIDKTYTVSGQNIQLSAWYDGSLPSRIWEQFGAALAGHGVKLELDLIMEDQVATVFQTLLATGRLNDYDWVNPGGNIDEKTRIALVNQGRLYPLNRALEQYSAGPAKDFYMNGAGQFYAKGTTLSDGNFYWLTHTGATYYLDPSNYQGSPKSGIIRKDWLDAVGLGIPTTPDEFYNALVTFQQRDVNGNGLKDEVASVSLEHFGTGIAQWFGLGTFGDGFRLISCIDNKVVSPWYQDTVRDYITFMNKLYKAGLINVSSEGNDMAANRIAYQYDWSIESWVEPGVVVQTGAAKPYYVPFVAQALPNTPGRVWHQEGLSIGHWSMHFIPAGAKNVAAATRMLDYFVTEDYAILSESGIEGYTFVYDANGNMQYLEQGSGTLGQDVNLMKNLPALWTNNSLFPRYERYDRNTEINQVLSVGRNLGYADSWKLKGDFVAGALTGKYAFVQDVDSLMAYPTVNEVDRMAAIKPDLETYANELLTALILGEKSLNNWSSYMADLRRLGLDEYLAICQARVDRMR
jgi:putative aldouronate transport system substrate-binding protein